MNLIKRITTTMTASMDSAVGQIENHDAIVAATIKKTRRAVARTQARVNTLRQQRQLLEQQSVQAAEQRDVWEQRAREILDRDEAKALQCLTRRNQCEAEINHLQQSIDDQQVLIGKVNESLESLKGKLQEMEQKHNLMRSRQAVAETNRAVAFAQSDDDLHDTFERWESVVLEHELGSPSAPPTDVLEQEFSRTETEQELKAQLEALRTESSVEDSPRGGQR